MNAEPQPKKSSGGGLDMEVLFPLVLAVAVGALAVTAQSFWMDEASTGLIAVQPSPGGWWRSLLLSKGSSNQMPLYMLYIWVWEKLSDDPTEWALRAANIPWLALGWLAIPRRQGLFLLTLAASPFLWYYLSECRPYLMQVSCSLLMLGAVWRLREMPEKNGAPEKIWTGAFCLGAVLLSGSSMLAVIWMVAGVVAAAAVLGWQRGGRLLRRNWPIFLLTVLALTLLAGYYVWSLRHNRGTMFGSTGVGNAVFVVYELAGFSGLGPGRLDLRTGGVAVFLPFLAPLLLYAVVLAGVLFAGCKYILQKTPRRVWLGVAAALGAAAAGLLAGGVVLHFRVLGRHFAPLAPCLLLIIAFGLRQLAARGGWRRLVVVAFLLLSLASALSLRFCERHVRDDYRTAATIATEAANHGQLVWWCADGGGAVFYGVPLAMPEPGDAAMGRVWWVNEATDDWLTNTAPPDLLLLSKPEVHDINGRIHGFLERNHYELSRTFPAFTVWRKPQNYIYSRFNQPWHR